MIFHIMTFKIIIRNISYFVESVVWPYLSCFGLVFAQEFLQKPFWFCNCKIGKEGNEINSEMRSLKCMKYSNTNLLRIDPEHSRLLNPNVSPRSIKRSKMIFKYYITIFCITSWFCISFSLHWCFCYSQEWRFNYNTTVFLLFNKSNWKREFIKFLVSRGYQIL